MNRAQHTREEILNSTPRKGFFGHPKGLSTLFLTEFWERFSYYGMKAILVYYLYYSVAKGGFGLDEGVALQIVSIYGTLIYMSGIIGGMDCRSDYRNPTRSLLRWHLDYDWSYSPIFT